MKKIVSIGLLFTLMPCFKAPGQSGGKEFYSKEFKWKIVIPEGFKEVPADEWSKIQNKGADAIEKTFDEKVINYSKTIFVFNSDQLNYFEANYQPFDSMSLDDYSVTVNSTNQILYETFTSQMPDVAIDTVTSIETIDSMVFHKHKIVINYSGKMILNLILYSRLFNDKEFSVNIMFVDSKKGELMLDAFRNSKFRKDQSN